MSFLNIGKNKRHDDLDISKVKEATNSLNKVGEKLNPNFKNPFAEDMQKKQNSSSFNNLQNNDWGSSNLDNNQNKTENLSALSNNTNNVETNTLNSFQSSNSNIKNISENKGAHSNPFSQQSFNNNNNNFRQESISNLNRSNFNDNTNLPINNENPFEITKPPEELTSKIPTNNQNNNNSSFNPPNELTDFQNNQNALKNSKTNLNLDEIYEIVDETVEKVIEEKWDVLISKVDKVLKWKNKKDLEINMLKEDIINIAESFEKLEDKLINKISKYDKNILDVNSEIRALEKVFQKITPTLVNNINELSHITTELKEFKQDVVKNESVTTKKRNR